MRGVVLAASLSHPLQRPKVGKVEVNTHTNATVGKSIIRDVCEWDECRCVLSTDWHNNNNNNWLAGRSARVRARQQTRTAGQV